MCPKRGAALSLDEPEKNISNSELRTRALRGGAFVLVRQALGMVISVASVLFVTRVIGPAQYGIFASAYGIVFFLAGMGTWGVDVYLLRRTEEPSKRQYAIGFTLLLCISLGFASLVVIGRTLIAAAIHIRDVSSLIMALSLYIPLNLIALPATVQLDKELRFRAVAINELVSQILNVCVSIPLALKGAGAWAPALGILAQQFSLLLMTYITSGFRPALAWDIVEVRKILTYGLSYSSSIWIWQVRTLINPILVARFAGPQAVGIVALAIRLADVLAFAKNATWRIAMAALAKLGERRDLLRRSIEEGMRLQALAAGGPLAIFAAVAITVFPRIFGHRWDAALYVFPFIAIGYLVNSTFNMHSSVLYLLRHNWQVTWFHLLHVCLFIATVALLMPHFGYIAYGYGELAGLLAYFLIHHFIVKAVGSLNYSAAAIWGCAIALVICSIEASPLIRLISIFSLLAPLLITKERRIIQGYIHMLISRGDAK